MEQKILIFKLLFIFITFYTSSAFPQTIIQGNAKIIDGDTIHIGKYKIRLHGIDAPEINQNCIIDKKLWSCGIESSKVLENYIFGNKVLCEIVDIDQYKRFVGICFVNKNNINQYMVRNGWAVAYRYYSLDFVEEENLAKMEKIGIWQGQFKEPYLFRKKKKK